VTLPRDEGLSRRARRGKSLVTASFLIFLLFSVLSVKAQAVLVLDPGSRVGTLAGSGRDGRTVAGTAQDVALGWPRGLAYDHEGNLYVADSRNHQIDRVSSGGVLAVVAGTGHQGYVGDGGAATAAELNAPTAVAVAPDGSVYFADSGNHCIRRIASGVITTVAGNGAPGFGGDGGPAMVARFRSPGGLAFAADGSLYVADTGNRRVRKIPPGGSVSTIAGTGTEDDAGDGGVATAASFRSPGALQVLPDGRLLIADREAYRVRALLADGTINAYETGATLRRPEGLGVDAAGGLLIADAGRQQMLLSGLDASGVVASASVAGSGRQGAAAVGVAAESAMDSPAGAAVDAGGSVAMSDRRNHQVQRVTLSSLAFGDVPAGRSSAAQALTLRNGGKESVRISAVLFPSGFIASGGSAGCPAAPFSLQAGASCVVGVTFAPIAQGQQTAFLRLLLEGAPAASVVLTGNATAVGSLAASSTTLSSDGSISFAGTPVEFSVVVRGLLGTVPAGNVTFLDGDVPLATVALTGGSATFATAGLRTGRHTVHAVYSGDAAYAGSVSADVTQTVVPAPDFTIAAAAGSYSGSAGGGIAIPLSIVPVNGTLNHTVRLGVSGLPAGATALFTPSVFTLGGDPANVSLALIMPTTLAGTGPSGVSRTMAGVIAGFFLLGWRRGFRPGVRVLCVVALVCAGGCGGGFQATSASNGTGGAAKTFHYAVIVTATSTDVMGAALVHTATINLTVSQ